MTDDRDHKSAIPKGLARHGSGFSNGGGCLENNDRIAFMNDICRLSGVVAWEVGYADS
jgi:hypothetical protein